MFFLEIIMEKEWLFKIGLGLLVFLVVFMAGFYSAMTGSFFHNTLPGTSISSSGLPSVSAGSAWYGTGNCGSGFKCSSDGTQCASGSQEKDCASGYYCGTSAGTTTCFKKKNTGKMCVNNYECSSGQCNVNECIDTSKSGKYSK